MRRWLPSLSLALLSLASAASGQELGATISKSGTIVTGVTFRVWAPNAVAVHVAGDFNNWATNSGTALSKSDSIWSGANSNARPGHAYKYVITTTNVTNGSNIVLWKKDPRARQVRTLTGGLPAHVTNGSSQQASVIYDPNAFDWRGDLFIPPDPKDIVMYEMHVGTFCDPTPNDGQPATFDDAIQKLDYLKGLGVNMIALMPVQEFNGRHSWGYNPSDPFAIEETYGGPDAFKRFVKAAHLKGMAVQVDVVHNHYGDLSGDSNIWTSLKTSDLENFDGGEPYFYNAADESTRPGISKTKWGPRPRYIDTNVQAYILDNIKMYLDEYKVWALRWDSPRNITGYQTNPGAVIGDPNAPISEAVTMMSNIHAEIRNPARTNSLRYYSIAEDANSPGGYHAHWEVSYHDAIFSRLLVTNHPPTGTTNDLPPPFNAKYTTNFPTMGNIQWRIENKEDPGFRVTFLENHDKCGDHNSATDGKRLAYDFDTNNPTSLNAKLKTLMAGAATLASAGTPMLWMGQEQLADGDFNDKKALDWSRATQFPGIVRFHRDMIHLRSALPALKAATNNSSQAPLVSVVTSVQTSGLLAFRRHDGVSSNNDVLVAMNFSPDTSALPTNARSGGFANVVLNSHTTNYDAGLANIGPLPGSIVAASSNVTMGPWSVVVFAKSNVVLPGNDANGNAVDDGIDLLTGGRVALPGTFNNWDTNTPAMKWDTNRKVYWYVSRFNSPGTNEFKAYTTNWADGGNGSFVNNPPSAWHIVFNPSNNIYETTNLGNATNAPPSEWKSFWFDSTNVADSVDSDGDGWSNLQEFQRGSDPTLHEEPRFAVVGAFNGWNWSQAADTNHSMQMRYMGQGIWKFFRWFPLGTADFSFKIAQGPTTDDPNWGRRQVQSPEPIFDGFARQVAAVNFFWRTNAPKTWQVLAFNERTAAYSITDALGAPDTDGDGMPDDWERFCGLDPSSANDATNDADEDSIGNLMEFFRGSSARDASDHFAEMWMPGDGDWSFGSKRKMVWNNSLAKWEFVLYSAPRTFELRFSADSGYANSWGWPSIGSVAGQAVRNPETNITLTLAATNQHIVRFDEISGEYSSALISTNDSDGDGLPDDWERFWGLSLASNDANEDADSDGVLNKFEYERGSSPRDASDSYSNLALVGSTLPYSGNSGWDRTDPRVRMRWVTNVGRWEALRFIPRARTLELRVNDLDATPGWITTSNISVSFPSRGHYIIQFEEFSKTYNVVSMATNDTNSNGLADYWEKYFGQTNAGGDSDGDGVNTLGEFVRGGDPETRDKSSVMHVHGHVSGWNFTNAVPMRWNSSLGIWEALVWTRQMNESPQRAKFVSVTNPAVAWANSNWGDGFTNNFPPVFPDGVADRGGDDIAYTLPSLPFHVLFEFDEVWGDYFAGPINTNDSDNDGLADEWAAYHQVSGAGGNPDNDSWLNVSEFRRGSNPTNADGDPKIMTVTGNTAPLPNWNPAAANMSWSDQRLRWEWTATFTSTANAELKFARGDWGNSWGWGSAPSPGLAVPGGPSNIIVPVTNGVRYLIHFDDLSGQYRVDPHPLWLDWLKTNNLDTNTPRNPWTLDTDGDGIANFQEYALGGNPNLRDQAAAPTSAVAGTNGTNRLVLRWLERTNKDASLIFSPQLSTNLASNNWVPPSLGASNSVDTNGVPAGYRRREFSEPIEGPGKFLRIRVNGP